MAEAGGILGCCLLLGCCGACFMAGRGCKSDDSTQVRESQEQSSRIVVTPVAVSPMASQPSVPAGYIVMADPVTGQQQIYAPVATATTTAAAPSAPDVDGLHHSTTAMLGEPATSSRGDLNTPLL